MNPVGLVSALIVAGLVIVCLGITAFALWENGSDHKAEAVNAWRIVRKVEVERDQLMADLRLMTDHRDSQKQRADWLLAQVYDMRNEMVRSGHRPETACVDAWADGRAPCEKCAPLLPGART